MAFSKRIFSILVFSLLIPVASCSAQSDGAAPDASQFQEGKDYARLLRPVDTADPEKIEVVEVFWYGCSHCYNLEPQIEHWLPTLDEDVYFVRFPAIWAEVLELHAKMFYANEALGLTEQLHRPIFDEMKNYWSSGKTPMPTEESILDFVEDQGVDREKYRRALNSFGVSSQVLKVPPKMGAYRVQGTPELVINGKYKLTVKMAGSHKRMFEIANALIEQERQAQQ